MYTSHKASIFTGSKPFLLLIILWFSGHLFGETDWIKGPKSDTFRIPEITIKASPLVIFGLSTGRPRITIGFESKISDYYSVDVSGFWSFNAFNHKPLNINSGAGTHLQLRQYFLKKKPNFLSLQYTYFNQNKEVLRSSIPQPQNANKAFYISHRFSLNYGVNQAINSSSRFADTDPLDWPIELMVGVGIDYANNNFNGSDPQSIADLEHLRPFIPQPNGYSLLPFLNFGIRIGFIAKK